MLRQLIAWKINIRKLKFSLNCLTKDNGSAYCQILKNERTKVDLVMFVSKILIYIVCTRMVKG